MHRHHDGHVQRSDTNGEDFGIDQVGCTEPTNGPGNCVKKNRNDGHGRGVFDRRVAGDVVGAHAVCATQVSSQVDQCRNLQADTGDEGSSTTNKVDNEQCEQKCRDKLDNAIDTSRQELDFGALNAELVSVSTYVCSQAGNTLTYPRIVGEYCVMALAPDHCPNV